MSLLLERGGNLESRTGTDGTPLVWGCMGGNAPVVRYLLERGANISAITKVRGGEGGGSGRRTEEEALSRARESVNELILRAACSHVCSGGECPVPCCCPGRGVILPQSPTRQTSRDCCCPHPRFRPSSIRPQGKGTALHHATHSGYPEVVSLLLEKGANPKAQDNRGERPGDKFDPEVCVCVCAGKESLFGCCCWLSSNNEEGKSWR